ncbi:uncharacterized protein LTR77_004780 [Saxophila tyrrhenica]|uniref:Uncharacterized protein n=1 Tax=Saxophila tyrrhenica TaxID=1690608 RepID=A0AAV9PCG3_9PEZI|nr:hypothetical protein LTR77_004780 [Saxophila tyrrhenica]
MAQNGLTNGTAAMYGGGPNVVLSSPGYHSDMQILMDNMEKLSGTLQRNRQEWSQVQEGLERVGRLQGRLARDGQLPLVNGDISSHEETADESPNVLQLQNELANSYHRLNDLRESFTQLQAVHEEYSKGLEAATQMAQDFQEKEQKYIQSVHEDYSAQLLQARNETMQAQLTHQAWQARLQTLDETVKAAYKAREEEGQPYRRRIAALKEENRILRAKAGWDPPPDSEDEDWDDEGILDVEGKGRGSQGSHGAERGDRMPNLVQGLAG